MQVFHCFVSFRLLVAGTMERRMRVAVLASLLTLLNCSAAIAEGAAEAPQPSVRLIGATTVVTEVSSGLPLPARVDTGATTCSVHCEALEIKDAHPDPKENIGKSIRFLITNKNGKQEWVEAKIVDHVTVRTSTSESERYKVKLKLRLEDVEKKVAVTLHDRQHMKYPLLLGRNFLRDDFLVNVSLDAKE